MSAVYSQHKAPLRHRLPPKTARALGWFSIGLGAAELLMPHWVARLTGLRGSESLLRVYGVREIATGIGILTARDPKPWVWARVAGDTLDLATLGALAGEHNPHHVRNCVAMAAVTSLAGVDVACAQGLGHKPLPLLHDCSDRSGLPRPAAEMRGAAPEDFSAPPDMCTPEPLRPNAVH